MEIAGGGEDPVTFNQFLTTVRYSQHQKFARFNPHYRSVSTPFTFLPQSFYVFDSACKLNIDRVFKFEQLNELEKELGFTLPTLNAGKYPTEEVTGAMTPENIALINYIYKEDFEVFGYPYLDT
jgi:hypothetical protein